MTPACARIKRGVHAAVDLCGGGDGAARTAQRRRSVAYDWGNLNHEAFPPLDCAFAMDEVALAMGRPPAILHAYAAELDHIAVRLPVVALGADPITDALVECSAEFGEVAIEVREATRDGVLDTHERDAIVRRIDDALAALTRMRAIARVPETLMPP